MGSETPLKSRGIIKADTKVNVSDMKKTKDLFGKEQPPPTYDSCNESRPYTDPSAPMEEEMIVKPAIKEREPLNTKNDM